MAITAIVALSLGQHLKPSCNQETLAYFQDSIKVHLKPTSESYSKACQDEFAKYQTCCETESLRDFIEKVVESDSLRWNNALKNVYLFKKEVLANKDIFVKKINELYNQVDAAVRDGRVKQVAFDSIKLLSKFLPNMTIEKYAITAANYKKEAQSCFDEITTLRKNAMCLICSGRSQTFFNGQRMTIKQRTCEGLTQSCYNTFSFMFETMGTTRALFDLYNALARTNYFPVARDPLPYNSRVL